MSVRKRKWTTASGAEREAWCIDYVDQGGNRRHKTFQKKKDADAWASKTAVEISRGEHVTEAATITMAEATEQWLKSAEAAKLERTTIRAYTTETNLHVLPFLGRTKLSQLSVSAVRRWQDQLREEGRSAAMVRRVTTLLGGIIGEAQERDQASRNPVAELSRRRTRTEQRHKAKLRVGTDIPLPAEVAAIMQHAEGRWRPLLVTAAFTGMRASELRGLSWHHVDLNAGVIHVRQRADRFNQMGSPKSHAGQRAIPIGPYVVNTLREWKLAQRTAGPLNLVFPNLRGNIEVIQNIVVRGFQPAVIAAGIVDSDGNAKYTGMHTLRHFYASWCINRREDGGLGLPLKNVQERLGHSSITMTADRYGHLFPSTDDAEALDAAEQALLSAVRAT